MPAPLWEPAALGRDGLLYQTSGDRVRPDDRPRRPTRALPTDGPRILLCLDGEVDVVTSTDATAPDARATQSSWSTPTAPSTWMAPAPPRWPASPHCSSDPVRRRTIDPGPSFVPQRVDVGVDHDLDQSSVCTSARQPSSSSALLASPISGRRLVRAQVALVAAHVLLPVESGVLEGRDHEVADAEAGAGRQHVVLRAGPPGASATCLRRTPAHSPSRGRRRDHPCRGSPGGRPGSGPPPG